VSTSRLNTTGAPIGLFVVGILLTASVASAGVSASLLPTFDGGPNLIAPRQKGGDTVSLYGGLISRLAWVTSTGLTVSEDWTNCGSNLWTFSDQFVMDKRVNEVCECNGRSNPGPVSVGWCLNTYLIQRPGPRVLGIVGSEILYRKCNNLAFRWSSSQGEFAVPDAASDWIEFRTDEGTHVLEYGTDGQPLGLRAVNSTGSGVSLGQVLYPPNGAWLVMDYSLKADSITVRVANATTGARRCDLFLKSGNSWSLSRSIMDSNLGGEIIGVGDRRAAVWSSGQPSQVAVFRIDGSAPFIETMFDLPATLDGTAYSAIPFAYVRRGQLVSSARWAAGSRAGIILGHRVEQVLPCPGDLNADRVLDGADIGLLLDQWGVATGLTIADINHDGVVNGADLGLLLSSWGACP
jgi:hypothetical protein